MGDALPELLGDMDWPGLASRWAIILAERKTNADTEHIGFGLKTQIFNTSRKIVTCAESVLYATKDLVC
jgi:hypothetical protein